MPVVKVRVTTEAQVGVMWDHTWLELNGGQATGTPAIGEAVQLTWALVGHPQTPCKIELNTPGSTNEIKMIIGKNPTNDRIPMNGWRGAGYLRFMVIKKVVKKEGGATQ